MNKKDLVDQIALRADITKAQAKASLEGFLETVVDALAEGEDVSLIGFGTFTVKDRAARIGRNPQTGEELQIAAAKVPAFKAGKSLKDSLNKI